MTDVHSLICIYYHYCYWYDFIPPFLIVIVIAVDAAIVVVDVKLFIVIVIITMIMIMITITIVIITIFISIAIIIIIIAIIVVVAIVMVNVDFVAIDDFVITIIYIMIFSSKYCNDGIIINRPTIIFLVIAIFITYHQGCYDWKMMWKSSSYFLRNSFVIHLMMQN